MNKRTKILSLGLIIVFGGLVGFNLLKSFLIQRFFATFEFPPATVSSTTVKSVDWQPRIDAVGNFVAINGVEVNSEISGNVIKIDFDSGQYIEKDQPLITIDDSVQQATLKFNQAELDLKQLSYQRQADLNKRGAAPVSNVDEARAELEKAQANVEKTQAEIAQKHIAAPFTGRLGIRLVNLGQYIKPGDTTIVTLQSMDPLYLQFYLPEQLYKKIHLNQIVNFSIDEFPNALFQGKITAINAKVDPNTHNVLIQATLPNCPAAALKDPKNSKLISISQQPRSSKFIVNCDSKRNSLAHIKEFTFVPGMFAALEIEEPLQPNTLIVPSTAISYSLYGDSVFLISKTDKKSKEGKPIFTVQRVFVKTGEQRGNYTVILKGLKAGDEIVSSGELKLDNGAAVVINNEVQLGDTADLQALGQ